MSLYAGIDLHSTNSVLAVIDEHDRVLRQCRLPNELSTILKAMGPYRDELVGVAVESTYNWYWLVDGLTEHSYPMHLVNTAAVPQYDGLKYSGDESDARHLAHLMRLGILPEGYIYPRDERAVRDLLRRRFRFRSPECISAAVGAIGMGTTHRAVPIRQRLSSDQRQNLGADLRR